MAASASIMASPPGKRATCPGCICGRDNLISLDPAVSSAAREKIQGFNRNASVEPKRVWYGVASKIKWQTEQAAAYALFSQIEQRYGLVIPYPGRTTSALWVGQSIELVISREGSMGIENKVGACRLLQEIIRKAVRDLALEHPNWFEDVPSSPLYEVQRSIEQAVRSMANLDDFLRIRDQLRAQRISFMIDGNGKIRLGHMEKWHDFASRIKRLLEQFLQVEEHKYILRAILERSSDSFLNPDGVTFSDD